MVLGDPKQLLSIHHPKELLQSDCLQISGLKHHYFPSFSSISQNDSVAMRVSHEIGSMTVMKVDFLHNYAVLSLR